MNELTTTETNIPDYGSDQDRGRQQAIMYRQAVFGDMADSDASMHELLEKHLPELPDSSYRWKFKTKYFLGDTRNYVVMLQKKGWIFWSTVGMDNFITVFKRDDLRNERDYVAHIILTAYSVWDEYVTHHVPIRKIPQSLIVQGKDCSCGCHGS